MRLVWDWVVGGNWKVLSETAHKNWKGPLKFLIRAMKDEEENVMRRGKKEQARYVLAEQ